MTAAMRLRDLRKMYEWRKREKVVKLEKKDHLGVRLARSSRAPTRSDDIFVPSVFTVAVALFKHDGAQPAPIPALASTSASRNSDAPTYLLLHLSEVLSNFQSIWASKCCKMRFSGLCQRSGRAEMVLCDTYPLCSRHVDDFPPHPSPTKVRIC